MFYTFTQVTTSFSVISAIILLFAYLFFLENMRKTPIGMIACAFLLGGLTGLQLLHLGFLSTATDLFDTTLYVTLLLAIPPAFFFFSREILLPESRVSWVSVVHIVPLLLASILPADLVAPIAFTIGAGYSIWFARIVYGLRQHVSRFKFEMFFFGFFAVLAVLVLILGLLIPFIDTSYFYLAYANFTGIAMMLIIAALIIFPEILTDIEDAVNLAYTSSTLHEIDIEKTLVRLDIVMATEKLFQNENLNLSMLANSVNLNSHQLSELINTHFGFGFSRYVRAQRVAEATRLLKADPAASVLSIGMTTGFRSQSNFYAAFREITGESPGNYRKKSRSA